MYQGILMLSLDVELQVDEYQASKNSFKVYKVKYYISSSQDPKMCDFIIYYISELKKNLKI